MINCRVLQRSAKALLATTLVFAAGCVESFGGSHIQWAFSGSVQVPGMDGDNGRPPPGTHYTFYAVDLEYQLDDDGDPVLDEDGEPIVERSFAFKVLDFEIVPVIDLNEPCFIEDEEARYPGAHATSALEMLEAELQIKYGVAEFDPFDPPDNVDEGDVIDVLTARKRESNMLLLLNPDTGIKAITSHGVATPPPVAAGCDNVGAGEVPPPACIDAASNALRRQRCEAFFADNPAYYVGSDKVFTLPLSGEFFGLVDANDPRSGIPLSGAETFVDIDLRGIESMLMNWQYDCTPEGFATDPFGCEPDYPASLPPEDRSLIGFHYMSGLAREATRRTINVPMRNRVFAPLSGEIAIYPDLDDDDVRF